MYKQYASTSNYYTAVDFSHTSSWSFGAFEAIEMPYDTIALTLNPDADVAADLDVVDVAMTGPSPIDAINWGTVLAGASDEGTLLIPYFFQQEMEDFVDGVDALNWTEYEMTQMRVAFDVIETFIDVEFVEVDSIEDATFKLAIEENAGAGYSAFMFPPEFTDDAGTGVFNRASGFFNEDANSWDVGGAGFGVVLHELGHGLGLAHPHDGGGTSSVMNGVTSAQGSLGDFNLNQGVYTIMSYNDAWVTSPTGQTTDLSYGWSASFGPLDIAHLQALYGANTTTGEGDSVYELPAETGAGAYYQTIWDVSGNDTIVATAATDAMISLIAAPIEYAPNGLGTVSHSMGVIGGLLIAHGVVIENATGNDGNDTLIGNAAGNVLSGMDGDDSLMGNDGNDTLIGGEGADMLDGGAGFDIADYSGSDAAVLVRLWNGTGEGGHAQGDTLTNIEGVIGSAFDDTLVGSDNDDYLAGGEGDDNLFGLAGDDMLAGGAGADMIDGGDGSDYADYSDSDAFVSVRLFNGVVSGGHAEGDTLVSIENAIGSQFGDLLIGSDGDNKLHGGDGNDDIYGLDGDDMLWGDAGNDIIGGGDGNDMVHGGEGDDTLGGDAGDDTLMGGDGADMLDGGAGDDMLNGGAGADTIDGGDGTDVVDYSGSDAALTADLEANTFVGGHAEGDTVSNIEGVMGTEFDDTLSGRLTENDILAGGAGMDVLRGHGGDDDLDGGDGNDMLYGGAGADMIEGGDGEDTAYYNESDAGVVVRLWNGTGLGGDAEGDMLSGVENLWGSAFDDVLIGANDADNKLWGGEGDDELYGLTGDDMLVGGAGADVLDGGDGMDTADYSASGEAIVVRLFNGTGEGGDAEGDTLTSIESVVGTDFSDVLIGNDDAMGADTLNGGAGDDYINGLDGNDTLIGGAGADDLDGGDGMDTADYSGSSEGVTVRLWNGTGLGGDAEGDTLTSIENITGSDHSDVLIGANGMDNMLKGGAGDDVLFGLTGDDTLYGGDGDDFINGGAGNDMINGGDGTDTADYSDAESGISAILPNGFVDGGTGNFDTVTSVENIIGTDFDDTLIGTFDEANVLEGGAGDDYLNGLGGGDTLDGGDGVDTVGFFNSDAGVMVDLAAGTASGGHAEGATLIGIENLLGSFFDDVLTGDDGDNVLNGNDGDDVLTGGAGADELNGGSGNDMIDYSDSDAAVSVRLWNQTATGGHADGDTLSSIEGVTGSAFSDVLIGSSADNYIVGGAGDDYINGLDGGDLLDGGAGADTIDGGDGYDYADYRMSTAGVNVSLTSGFGTGGDAEGDLVLFVEGLAGSEFNDTLEGTANQSNDLFGFGGDDMLIGLGGGDYLSGGTGTDTVDYSGMTSGVSVYLFASLAFTGSGTDDLISIENINGSDFDDLMFGAFAVDNVFNGGDGDDILIGLSGSNTYDGGDGSDTVEYYNSNAGVTVDLAAGTASGGHADGDTLTSIENIYGSRFDDMITGSDADNTIWGDSGNDVISGMAGADMLYGGSGFDTVDYSASDAAVIIRLFNNTAEGGHADGDVIADFEAVIGSAFSDVLIGSDSSDMLNGGAGDDYMNGRDGNDVMIGGEGADILDGGDGTDMADYSDSSEGVQVRLWNGTGVGGDSEGDELISIEDLQGSDHADLLIGDDATNNWIWGGDGGDDIFGLDGDDVLIGEDGNDGLWGGAGSDSLYGGEGDDSLMGGEGDDFLSGGDGNDTIEGGAGADNMYGGDGNDTFVFAIGDGADQIMDFDADDDMLLFNNVADGTSAQDLRDMMVQSGADVLLDLGNGDAVRLVNVTLSDVSVDNISIGSTADSAEVEAANNATPIFSDFQGVENIDRFDFASDDALPATVEGSPTEMYDGAFGEESDLEHPFIEPEEGHDHSEVVDADAGMFNIADHLAGQFGEFFDIA